MMLDKDIQEIIGANTERSAIWYGSVKYRILKNRKWYPFQCDKIVMKGTKSEVLKNKMTKKRVLNKYFGGDKAANKKVKDFDLNKIELYDIIIYKFLGYGVKQD